MAFAALPAILSALGGTAAAGAAGIGAGALAAGAAGAGALGSAASGAGGLSSLFSSAAPSIAQTLATAGPPVSVASAAPNIANAATGLTHGDLALAAGMGTPGAMPNATSVAAKSAGTAVEAPWYEGLKQYVMGPNADGSPAAQALTSTNNSLADEGFNRIAHSFGGGGITGYGPSPYKGGVFGPTPNRGFMELARLMQQIGGGRGRGRY